MKKLLPWLAGLLVIFAIYLYASPYIALYNIKNAAEQKDADKLSGYIDFPSVKQSIKNQVKAAMVEDIAASDEQDGFEALGTMLAAAMIDPIVDGVVTPDGVALMLQGQELDFDLDKKKTKDEPKIRDTDIDYQAGYLSFDRFKVQIIDPDDADKSLDVIMHRDGLSWKVTRIAFSLDFGDEPDVSLEEAMVSNLVTADESYIVDEAENDEFEDVFHGIADSEEVSDTVDEGFYNTDTFDDEDYIDAYAVESTEPLTPSQAAYIDYLVDNDIEVSQDMIDLLNDFTFAGSTDADLRQFIIERSGYDDGYNPLADCRNPDFTEAQYINNCS
ncbi:DUF2939 domain-containing protein [Psychrobacter sp. AOP7-B1-24]|uniref:DUF2939 domain-containing protein n=1 Tax=Psychrobacter sp. AOP7-B1-24 TaxID=3457645 RepID=UPI00402BF406